MKPISFIIITYNRAADTLELLQNISSLNNSTTLLQDVIVVNNASTENYDAVKNYISKTTSLPFKYIDAPSNLGVTKGRNFVRFNLPKVKYVFFWMMMPYLATTMHLKM
jgi:glycosyltransferase involved in cell wall biosynthesis